MDINQAQQSEQNLKPVSSGEKAIFGHKLFFIAPPHNLCIGLIPQLHNKEYETYIIQDYKDAKNILRNNPDSICYFCVDSQLSKNGWVNFLSSFADDENLKKEYIGVITHKIDAKLRDKFMTSIDIRAGLITLDESDDKILEEIVDILEANNAKGRRQYVRAKINKDSTTYLMWYTQDKFLKFNMQDISSVGMAIDIPSSYASYFKTGILMKGLSIKFDTRQFDITALVYALKPKADGFIGVLLIKDISHEARSFIREYVAESLQNELFAKIDTSIPDKTDYENKH